MRVRPRLVRRRGTLKRVDAAQQVIEAAMERASALAEGSAGRLSSLTHEEFRWTSHVGATYDRAEYVRRNTEGDTVWRSQRLLNPEVVVAGETAVLLAEVEDVVRTDGGEAQTFRLQMTQVWVRSGADWKCLAGHAGPLSS